MNPGRFSSAGFTLIELLLSIVIITALAGLSIPLIRSSQTKNDLSLAVLAFSQSARRAQAQARLASQDDSWGVKILSGEVVVFKGVSYASRDTNYDSSTKVSDAVSISGDDEIAFSKITGGLDAGGSLTLTDATGETVTTTINDEGVVSY